MRNYIKSLFQLKDISKNFQNAGLYFLGSILQSVLALITQPIYSMYLSADEFGIIGYFNAIKNVFTPLFILGMTSVYLMNYFKQDEEDNKKMLFNITFYLCLFNTGFLVISYAGLYTYFSILKVNIPLNPFGWFILVTLVLDNIKSIVLINFRVRKKAFSFFSFSAVNSVLNVLIGLLFVAILKWGAEGRMLAPIISTVLMLPAAIFILKKYTTINFNFTVFKSYTKVALPLVLAAYAFVPIGNIDRFYLERLDNLTELGLYNIGITIAGYVQLAYTALALALEPDIFKSIAEKKLNELLKVAVIMFLPFLMFVIVFMFFSDTIISILTAGRYIAAQQYTNIALFSVFLMGIFSFFDKIFVALGKTKLNLQVNVIGGITAVAVMYMAVQNYQYIGAAYGKVVVAFIMVVSAGYLAKKHLKLQQVI